MTPERSVSDWLARLREGDQEAAREIWQRYFRRLVRLARSKLPRARRRAVDGEDLALSAIASFCHGVKEGRFRGLDDRDDLWPFLVTITARKALRHLDREFRQKRGGGRVLGESGFGPPRSGSGAGGLGEVPGQEPPPDVAAMAAEQCDWLLGKLDDEVLKSMAIAKLEGCSNLEVAERLGLSLRSVERKLRLIRRIWSEANSR